MKRVLTVLLIAAVALSAAACGGTVKPVASEPATQTGTQLHTIPPEEKPAALEWAPVDCEISLDSSTSVYAESSDFLTFALAGSTDEDCELRFIINDETAKMLSAEKPSEDCYLTVNGKVLKGAVAFSDDFSELSMKGGYTYAEMCALATEIRGL